MKWDLCIPWERGKKEMRLGQFFLPPPISPLPQEEHLLHLYQQINNLLHFCMSEIGHKTWVKTLTCVQILCFFDSSLVCSGSDVFPLPMLRVVCASLRRTHASRQCGQHSSKPQQPNQLLSRAVIYWELSMCSTHGVLCPVEPAAWLLWATLTLVTHWWQDKLE